MSHLSVDQTSDPQGVQLFKFSQLYEFPSFVKSADFQQVMSPARLSHTAYADYYGQRFPCHTKAATWISAVYFFENRGSLNPKQASAIEQRLDQFAAYHKIRNAYEAVKEQHSSLHKEASLQDDQFAYVWRSEDGRVERRCPLRNPLEIKTAAEWFQKYRDHWAFADRQKIARRILKKADECGVCISDSLDTALRKQAGEGLPNPKEVSRMLDNRAKLIDNPTLKGQVQKLADTVRTTPRFSLGPGQLEKLAATIDRLDRITGISRKYSEAVPRPEDVLFQVTYKEASGYVDDCCRLTTGNIYNKQDLSSLKTADLQDLFGDDFVREVSTGFGVDAEKLATIAHTLPRGEAELLDRLLADCNVRPLAKQAESAKLGFSKEQLTAMAGI